MKGKGNLSVPDLTHLVLSAITLCVHDKDEGGFDVWDCDVLSLEVQIRVGKSKERNQGYFGLFSHVWIL